MFQRFARFKIGWALAAAWMAASGWAVSTPPQSDTSAKGIYLSDGENRKTGVKFNVLLNRDGRSRVVPTNHRFRNNDRMKFQFTLNRDAYVYVVHRTFQGDPASERVRRYAGPKGIEIVRDDHRDRRRSPDRDRGRADRGRASFQLLFPHEKAGRDNHLKKRRLYTVPAARDRYFTMDENPGIEKLYLVVSSRKLDIGDHFNLADGGVRRDRPTSGDGRRDDSDRDVLDRLTSKLADYAGNTDVSMAKGMGIEDTDGYGVGVDRNRPLMIEVDLAHHRD